MDIELPGWLEYVGGLVGEKFPQGDETACRRQADQWTHYADQLAGQQHAIEAAAKAALNGFAAGVTHDALVPELNSLTAGEHSLEKIVEQLRALAHAVDDAATEIEFAKEMFILNLGILAASLAAMIASAWINWGAPAEMAAAIAIAEAALSQIIRAAIGKIVSEAAVRIIERLAIKALEGAMMNAAISGGMNAAVQGQQMLQGHRDSFDWRSLGQDLQAGAIQGAVAAPFLKGPEARTPGFHPSERLGEFGRSFTGNTLGGLAAQAPSGQFDLMNAVRGGVVFGTMDGARPTPKSITDHWGGGETSPGPSPKGPELAGPASTPPAHATEATAVRSDRGDVPLNLGTSSNDQGGAHTSAGDVANTPSPPNAASAPPATPERSTATSSHPPDSQPAPTQSPSPRSSLSETTPPGGPHPADVPAARSGDSVTPQALDAHETADAAHPSAAGSDAAPAGSHHDAGAAPTRADAIPAADRGVARGPDLADPAQARAADRVDAASTPRAPDRVPTAPASRGADRVDTTPSTKAPERSDATQPGATGARLTDASQPSADAARAPAATHAPDAVAKPAEVRANEAAGGPSPTRKDAAAQPESRHHDPGSPDAPPLLGPAVFAGDGVAHGGPAGSPHEPRAVTEASAPNRAAPLPDRGEPQPHAGVSPDDGGRAGGPGHIDASTLPEYRQRQMELALSPEKLERDLLEGGCPPEVAASARRSPYEGMTRQELLERYCHPDGSVRWPPHDGFADGRFDVANRIPAGEPLDRIGEISMQRGDFLGSVGDSYPARALAPGSSGQYHRLEGTGKQFSRPTWELRYGTIAEAFDQPGGGKQWVVVDTAKVIDGAPQKILIDQLVKEGRVRVVQPDVEHPHSALGDAVRRLVDDSHLPPHSSERQLDHQPLFHGEELPADERRALREAWDRFTPEERRYLYSREPMFGEHAGLPVRECDQHARQAIDDIRRDITERAGWRELTAGEQHRLRVLDNIENCLDRNPGSPERYLLGFEPDGRSITAVGNPDTARATVVFVPGTFTSDARLNDHPAQPGAKNLFGLLDRPKKTGYMEISERIWERLSDRLDTMDVAVIDYQNYHAPQSLVNPVTGAANPRFAQEGAPALRNHLDRLHDNGGDGQIWVAGHSYGTVLVGEGAKGGHGLNADGLINLGSPGMRVQDVSGLQLKGEQLIPGEAPVHTMTRVDDPIQVVDGARRTGLNRFGVGHGLMPHHPEFGGKVWQVDTNAGRQPDPHNAYFLPDSPALENIAKIVAGQQPPPEPTQTWAPPPSLPFTTGYFRPPPDAGWSAAGFGQDPPDLEDPRVLADSGRTTPILENPDEPE